MFINSLMYLVIQLVAKKSKAKENNAGIRCIFVLFLEKRYISQVIHFKHVIINLNIEILTVTFTKERCVHVLSRETSCLMTNRM